MLKKLKQRWKNDKILVCMEFLGYFILFFANLWIVTRPLPALEIIAYFVFANLIGFVIGLPIAFSLLSTVFKDRLGKIIGDIIELVKKDK
jgi:hypothetical protein